MSGSGADPQALDEPFDIVAYLLASSRDCLEGPLVYASLRMLEAAGRLASSPAAAGDPWLEGLRERIASGTLEVMADRERYLEWLDGLLGELGREARRRADA